MTNNELCPCGSDQLYSKCCELYHLGKENAATAVTLMRARYCSFVKHDISFIIDTHEPIGRKKLETKEIEAWAKDSTWLGLEIVETKDGNESDQFGTVEFIANYKIKGQKCSHHEISEFKKIDNLWFFSEGKVIQDSIKRDGPKIGRNEPCPCGSGKKYKKCCL